MVLWLALGAAGAAFIFLAACLALRIRYPKGYVEPSARMQRQLYDLARTVDEVLTLHGIPYWIESGTLLGAVRHHGLVPWDDDIDIVVPEEHDDRLRAAAADFTGRGLVLLKEYFGWKIGYVEDPFQADVSGPMLPSLIKYFLRFFRWSRYAYVDIFSKRRQEDGYVYSSSDCEARWPDESFIATGEIIPMKRYPFGPVRLNGPSNPCPYLERAYGDWRTGKVELGHHVPRYFSVLTLFMKRTAPVEIFRAQEDPLQIEGSGPEEPIVKTVSGPAP